MSFCRLVNTDERGQDTDEAEDTDSNKKGNKDSYRHPSFLSCQLQVPKDQESDGSDKSKNVA